MSRKVKFSHSCIENNNMKCFSTLHDYLVEISDELRETIYEEITSAAIAKTKKKLCQRLPRRQDG